MKNLQISPEAKSLGRQAAKGLVVFLIALVILGVAARLFGGTAQADKTTLQQSVEMAQADYDLSQAQAQAAIVQACNTWKGLASAKSDLAAAMKINSNLDKAQIEAVNCDNAKNLVPVSF